MSVSLGKVSDGMERAATASVAGSAILWGLYWIPLRHLEGLGIEGVWAGTLIYGVCAVLLLPLFLRGIRKQQLPLKRLMLCGLLLGAAFACYSASLLLTSVVRAMLLFYMTPAWGTLLGIALLGETVRIGRLLALASAFLGLMIVLEADIALPVPSTLGDWLALLGGMLWAWGTLLVFRLRAVRAFDHTFAWLVGAFVASLLLSALFGREVGAPPPAETIDAALGFSVIIALAVVFPMCLLTLWGCRYLTPGRVGLLLLGEVLVGVISAALLTDETFGLREALGSLLVIGASLFEPMGARWRAVAQTNAR